MFRALAPLAAPTVNGGPAVLAAPVSVTGDTTSSSTTSQSQSTSTTSPTAPPVTDASPQPPSTPETRELALAREGVFATTVGASSKKTLASWHVTSPAEVVEAMLALVDGPSSGAAAAALAHEEGGGGENL